MFSERFSSIPFGSDHMYLIADSHHILYLGPKAPSPMRLLRNDHHPLLQQATEELYAYFHGTRQHLSFAIEYPPFPFMKAVYTAALHIPYGECVSAAAIAQDIGYPQSVQAINHLCRSNPLCIRVPTHRILPSDGVSCEMDLTLRQMERRFLTP